MNVAEDAYFTNQYLDRTIRSPRSTSGTFEPRNGAEWDECLPPSQLSKSPSHTSFNSVADPDQLREAITPAQLTYLQRIDDRNRPQPVADYYHPERREAFPVFAPNSGSGDSAYANVRPRKKQAPPLSGYYIDQKRRYDVAENEAKPNTYTHKTFRSVFSKDRDERFNPADTVFEDTDGPKSSDSKETIQRAFKMVQKKIIKDNYNSYDYYRQNQKDKEREKEREREVSREQTKSTKRKWKLFQQKPKPEPEIIFRDEAAEAKPDIFVNETDGGGFVSETQAVPMWKEKWKTTKRALEDRLEEMQDRGAQSATDDCEEVAVDTANATLLPSSPAADNFNPMWNYVLSWLAYQQTAPADHLSGNGDSTSKEISPSLSSSAPRGTEKSSKRVKIKHLNSKAKNIMNKWNQPASSRYDRVIHQNMADDEYFDYPSELEVSDDEAEEAYMLDSRRQLKPYREGTSAMSPASGNHAGIISNVNSLIKSIRLMQIIFAPIDIIQAKFPSLQTAVILIELVIFVWLLYELSLLIDALCMAVRAVCAPMIAVGKFMNRIM